MPKRQVMDSTRSLGGLEMDLGAAFVYDYGQNEICLCFERGWRRNSDVMIPPMVDAMNGLYNGLG